MKVLIGISGSIAAYKAPLVVREILKREKMSEVRVVMTPSATRFIPALTLQNLTKHPVAVEMFDESTQSSGSWHIHLARWCDAMLIAPCSAATLGKLANGISDTALTTVALALPPEKPLLIAPAMDTEMWVHPATQRNCSILRGDGAYIIPPEEGELASGFFGAGRLPEPETLVGTLFAALQAPKFLRFSVLESGGTSAQNAAEFKTPQAASNQPSKYKPSAGESFDEYSRRFENYATQLDPKSAKQSGTRLSEAKQSETPDSKPNTAIEEALGKTVVNLQEGADAVKFDAELELTKLKREQRGEKPITTSSVDVGAVPFPLAGKKVLITAGPTYEKIDDVRFIGNYSSGKMGFALAEAAAGYGAKVSVVAGPVGLTLSEGLERIDVESAREMFDEVMKRRADADVIILAAAVADFTPSEKAEGKIKKEETGETMVLRLTKTPDILAAVGAVKGDTQVIVGFALEARNHLDNAQKKLVSKRADMIVLNALANSQAGKSKSGFDIDENTITILTNGKPPRDFEPMPKTECAKVILREAAALLAK